MTAVTSNGFFALKDEDTSLAELRDFFESKQCQLPAIEADLYSNVVQLLRAAVKIAPLLAEKDLELVMNALLNLSVTFTRDQTDEFVRLLCESSASEAFKGSGWHSRVR